MQRLRWQALQVWPVLAAAVAVGLVEWLALSRWRAVDALLDAQLRRKRRR
jgi:hypothetical protein